MSEGWVPTQFQQAEATKRSTPAPKAPAKKGGGLRGFMKRTRETQRTTQQGKYTGKDFKPGHKYNVHWFNSWQRHENRLVGAKCQKVDQHGVVWFIVKGGSKYVRPESVTYMKEVS